MMAYRARFFIVLVLSCILLLAMSSTVLAESLLHLVALTDEGRLLHTIQRASGWSPMDDVFSHTGTPWTINLFGNLLSARVVNVEVQTVGPDLHVLAVVRSEVCVNQIGNRCNEIGILFSLWHAVRKGDRTWEPFIRLTTPIGGVPGLRESLIHIGLGRVSDTLHLCMAS